MRSWRKAYHSFAARLLGRLAKQLCLEEEYFERKMRFWGKGQSHWKHTDMASVDGISGLDSVRMPPHTDPSLISIVVHDRSSSTIDTRNSSTTRVCPKGFGLQVYHCGRKG